MRDETNGHLPLVALNKELRRHRQEAEQHVGIERAKGSSGRRWDENVRRGRSSGGTRNRMIIDLSLPSDREGLPGPHSRT